MRGWSGLWERWADEVLAGGVLLLVVAGSLRSLVGSGQSWTATVPAWILITVSCGALYFSRRYPVAVAAVVVPATGVYYVTNEDEGPLLIAPIVALYMVAAAGRLQAALVVASVIVIGTGSGTLAGNEDVNEVAVFMLTGWVVAMVGLGWGRHTRRVYLREAAERAAGEERLRIARDLHDVAGHHISLINVQASTALHRFERDPAQAQAALAAIKESSRHALRDLRATLGVLRQADEDAPTAPTPDIDRIGELIESARAAGLTVHTELGALGGEPPPGGVGLAAYRIVQESLTNVVRHAAAGTVTVRVERGPEAVLVEVADDGRASAEPPGIGIRGMRERARALGGELTAGPGPDGGFLVRARLPLANGDS